MSNGDNQSRRNFLKVAAAAGATAAIAGCANTNDKKSDSALVAMAATMPTMAHVEGKQRIRVGLIGCGGRGSGAAANCCTAAKEAQIVAMGDVFKDHLDASRANLAKLGDQFNVTDDRCFVGLDAYQKVIDCGVDLVILATPPAFRPQHFKAAIDANKHVFFEKPVAVDATGCRAIMAASDVATQKKLSIATGTLFRHDFTHQEVIKRIHDGQIGDIIGGQSYYNVGGLWMKPRQPAWSDLEWQLRNWLYFTWLSGDHIVEQAIHRIDIQNWVMRSAPESAYGMGGRQVRIDPAYGNVYDHFTIEYTYPNGAKVMHMCRQIDGTDSKITQVYEGTKGSASPAEGIIKGANPYKHKTPTTNGYVQEWKDLFDGVRGGKYINEGRQIAEVTLTAIMGRMSAYTGKVITWEQAMTSQLDLMPKELAFGPTMSVAPVAVPGKDPVV